MFAKNESLNNYFSKFVLISTLAISLGACGLKKNDDSSGKDQAHAEDTFSVISSSAITYDAAKEKFGKAKCTNPVAVDSVSKNWLLISQADLVNGEAGNFELTKAILHTITINKNHESTSAIVKTLINRTDLTTDPLVFADCTDIPEGKPLTLESKVVDIFSQIDGTYSKKRKLSFLATDKSLNSVQKVLDETGTPMNTSDSEEDSLIRKIKDIGQFEKRIYRVSDREIEMRISIIIPDSSQKNTIVMLNYAYTYELFK